MEVRRRADGLSEVVKLSDAASTSRLRICDTISGAESSPSSKITDGMLFQKLPRSSKVELTILRLEIKDEVTTYWVPASNQAVPLEEVELDAESGAAAE